MLKLKFSLSRFGLLCKRDWEVGFATFLLVDATQSKESIFYREWVRDSVENLKFGQKTMHNTWKKMRVCYYRNASFAIRV